ncbi:5'-3' exonuclease H3TH domain-containing protein [Sodalis-like secondary symbiont of Drepanosiphum platanoidis]|uniref:5'-3' exonuclease n=1 Tax=Sodalis-like secondary symbiont of Drepanosiphum platanoidis TaxID=2994493 RepID=UPI0034643B9E
MKKKFLLVDGSIYLYKAYYSAPFLKNSLKKPSGAIFIMINMLKKLFIKYNPQYFLIVFDAGGKTFRHKLFFKYKSNRSSMPENLKKQIKPLYSILKSIGLPLISINGIEADDIIGTLAIKAQNNNFDVFINTDDKDMAQLVSKNINIISINNNILFKSKDIKKKFGINPSLIIDYLSLVGDDSDNIPGVLGIGKKTAIYLLNTIGNIKNIYKFLDKNKKLNISKNKFIKKTLIKNKKIAFLSYKLAKIKTNISLKFNIEKFIIKKPNIKKIIFWCNYFEFNSWKNNIKKILFI